MGHYAVALITELTQSAVVEATTEEEAVEMVKAMRDGGLLRPGFRRRIPVVLPADADQIARFEKSKPAPIDDTPIPDSQLAAVDELLKELDL